MTSFTTFVHVTGSSRALNEDLTYMKTIVRTVYANHAMVYRDWIGAATSRRKRGIRDEDVDWTNILDENVESIKSADLIIVEASHSRFSQGLQTYLATQYKKPTLVVTRSQIKNRFISGIEDKYISIKQYETEAGLELLITDFIKKNAIPEKDLRFNMTLDRRTFKFLRDKSYQTGANKSEIVRDILERAMGK